MPRYKFVLCILISWCHFSAQSISKKFYKNENLTRETNEEHAKFSKTITKLSNGRVVTIVKQINTDEIISRTEFMDEEPFGKWICRNSWGKFEEINYEFDVNYNRKKDLDTLINQYKIRDFLTDSNFINYVAPKILSGEISIIQFIRSNLIYPRKAVEEGIKGKVFIQLIVSKKGIVEHIAVLKGAHILLDKEAVRVIRKLKFNSPAFINGEAQTLNFNVPISFKL